MKVRVLQASHPDMIRALDTQALRRMYLADELFVPGEIRLVYSHIERFVIGGAQPLAEPLVLASPKEVGAGPFLARREIGVINIGGAGRVHVGGAVHELGPREGLYVGRNGGELRFESQSPDTPAKFYLASTPAHEIHPTRRITVQDAHPMPMGSPTTSNARTIYKYVDPEVCPSAQLLLGLTSLEPGSVWNTMPAHLHDRRSELYFYFDLDPKARVFHFMGEPRETRHIVVANEQAVISPPWSIHTGVGTASYSFIWAMGGDNQDYKDMDALPIAEML